MPEDLADRELEFFDAEALRLYYRTLIAAATSPDEIASLGAELKRRIKEGA